MLNHKTFLINQNIIIIISVLLFFYLNIFYLYNNAKLKIKDFENAKKEHKTILCKDKIKSLYFLHEYDDKHFICKKEGIETFEKDKIKTYDFGDCQIIDYKK